MRKTKKDLKESSFLIYFVVQKGPDTFCPVGNRLDVDKVKLPATIWVTVDGKERQRSSTSNMIWNVDELIAECSTLFTLEPVNQSKKRATCLSFLKIGLKGDLILTGTPEGVGPILPGQKIRAGIEGVCEHEWNVVAESSL